MRHFTATRFHEPTKRGLTKPFLVIAEDQANGEELTLVVKSNAGYEAHGGVDYMHREAYCLLLSRAIGLEAVEPVAVEIPPGFEFGALDYREHKGTDYFELITDSHGTNFATIHLGNDWMPWTDTTRPRKVPQESIDHSFCFDAMVQNDDRKKDNPNLLWKGDRLVSLDFDRAWCLGYFQNDARPWRKALERLKLRDSSLFPHIKLPKRAAILGEEMLKSLSINKLRRLSKSCIDEVETSFPGANLDFQELQPYVTKLSGEPEDFFQFLTAHCQP